MTRPQPASARRLLRPRWLLAALAFTVMSCQPSGAPPPQEHLGPIDHVGEPPGFIPPSLPSPSPGSTRAALASIHVPDHYLRVMIFNDLSRYQSLGASTETDAAAILDATNRLYLSGTLPLNIELVLVAQHTFTSSMPFTWTTTSSGEADTSSLLANFNSWHQGNLAQFPPHDVALLLTGLDLSGSDVGLAGIGTLGQPGSDGAVAQATFADDYDGQIVAHEIGHLLGMQHDGDGNACASSGYVMASVSCSNCGTAVTGFSTCSAQYLTDFLAANPVAAALFTESPEQNTWNGPRCGDGVTNGNEACDCGVWCAADPCCDGSTCSLRTSAASGQPAANYPATCSTVQRCCSSCQPVPRSAGRVCRPSKGECDLADTCNGAPDCPEDAVVGQGAVCDDGLTAQGGVCSGGGCHSFAAQCQRLESQYGVSGLVPCSYQAQFNGGNPCLVLFCGTNGDSTSCTSFGSGSNAQEVEDGTPCGTNQVCIGGSCVADSADECPDDAYKTSPGQCGCGFSEPDASGVCGVATGAASSSGSTSSSSGSTSSSSAGATAGSSTGSASATGTSGASSATSSSSSSTTAGSGSSSAATTGATGSGAAGISSSSASSSASSGDGGTSSSGASGATTDAGNSGSSSSGSGAVEGGCSTGLDGPSMLLIALGLVTLLRRRGPRSMPSTAGAQTRSSTPW